MPFLARHRNTDRTDNVPLGSHKAGDQVLGSIMLDLELGARDSVGWLGACFARLGLDGGQWWDSIFHSSASPEIVDLRNDNIIKNFQKETRSKIVRGTKPLTKRKICKLKIL